MKNKANILTLVLSLSIILGATWPAMANPLPQEPADEYLVNEDVNIFVGFYYREYSLAQNGIVDYRTARQILLSEYDEYYSTVVEAKEYPLFYWYDDNQDGEFEMWIDRKVEGCPCDIVRYQIDPSRP